MKKLIVAAMALSTLFFVGCGDDDDDDPPPDTTITVTADTTAAPATPLTYNDAVWNSVTPTTIALSQTFTLPVAPLRSPLGPSKSLTAPDSVDVQAIKKHGRLYLRLVWTDTDSSMQRDVWAYDQPFFNFIHQSYLGEDQVFVLFEGATLTGWDLWNWRVLTTGTMNRAEDGRMVDSNILWDDGPNRVASPNPSGDQLDKRPTYVHQDEWLFTGDILLKSERKLVTWEVTQNDDNWSNTMTVPGWIINDEGIDWDAESRWEVQAAYNYSAGEYTLVMTRSLTAREVEKDLDMTELGRIKTKIGIFDDDDDLSWNSSSSQRKFSADFWLVLP